MTRVDGASGDDRDRRDVRAEAIEQDVATRAEVGERGPHGLVVNAKATGQDTDVLSPMASVGSSSLVDAAEQDLADALVGAAHDADRPMARGGVHLSDNGPCRAAIARVLERHESRCLDDEDDREALADALSRALATELQLAARITEHQALAPATAREE